MTREEAINLLETTKHCDVDEVAKIKALEMAIAALREQEGKDTNVPAKWTSVEDRLPLEGCTPSAMLLLSEKPVFERRL